MSGYDEYTQRLLRDAQADFASHFKDLFGHPRRADQFKPFPTGDHSTTVKAPGTIRGGYAATRFSGVPVIESLYLTVDGEPDSAVHSDWRERYERNEARWLANRHRLHQRRFRSEPLWYTPQVPNPDIIKMENDGRTTFLAHPVTLRKVMKAMSEGLREGVQQQVYDALLHGDRR
jgi:hypothetical protein